MIQEFNKQPAPCRIAPLAFSSVMNTRSHSHSTHSTTSTTSATATPTPTEAPPPLPDPEDYGALHVRHAQQFLEVRRYIAKLVVNSNRFKDQVAELIGQNTVMSEQIRQLDARLAKTTATTRRYGKAMMELHDGIAALNDQNQQLLDTNARLQAQLYDVGIVAEDLPDFDEATMPPWNPAPSETAVSQLQFDELMSELTQS